jgi:membrane associated rhomboid family serine protease
MTSQVDQESAARPNIQQIIQKLSRVPVTVWIFLVIALMYCYTAILSGSFLVMRLDVIEFYGASWGALFLGRGWVLLTSIFVHQDILHFSLNSFSLVVIGLVLEREGGKKHLVIIFFMAALSTLLLSVVLFPMLVFVGTSAAIFGLAGATILRQLKSVIFGALFLLFLFALTPPLSFLAHGIGAVVGIVADQLIMKWNNNDNKKPMMVYSSMAP